MVIFKDAKEDTNHPEADPKNKYMFQLITNEVLSHYRQPIAKCFPELIVFSKDSSPGTILFHHLY